MFESEALTRGIRIHVQSYFVRERSSPENDEWFFAYRVTISNEGTETAQLISRHWVITDGNGTEDEVRGPGVVGEQPRLEPGESFQYTSACPLATPFGTMQGSYQMLTVGGEAFDAEIAPFALAEAQTVN